jgi:hypothetical protein
MELLFNIKDKRRAILALKRIMPLIDEEGFPLISHLYP